MVDKLLLLCLGAFAFALIGIEALRTDGLGGKAKICCMDNKVLLSATMIFLLGLVWLGVTFFSVSLGARI